MSRSDGFDAVCIQNVCFCSKKTNRRVRVVSLVFVSYLQFVAVLAYNCGSNNEARTKKWSGAWLLCNDDSRPVNPNLAKLAAEGKPVAQHPFGAFVEEVMDYST